MKKILNIAWNDIRVFFSERSTLIFFLVLPFITTAILGSVFSGSGGEPGEVIRFPVLVVDEDGSSLSQELSAVLEASDVVLPVFASRVEAETMFDAQEVPALLTIPAGFGESLLAVQAVEINLLTSPTDNRVFAIQQTIDAASARVGSAALSASISVAEAERIQPFESDAARQAYFEQGLELTLELLDDPPARVELTQGEFVRTSQNSSSAGVAQASAGMLVNFVLGTLLAASEVFVGERLGGTLRRLLMAPTSKATILVGKIVGRLSLGLLQMAVLIVGGALLFSVDWGRSPLAIAVMTLSFGLMAVALGVMLATFVKTVSQATGVSLMFSLSLASLGGAWWPLEITPEVYQTVVKVLPTTWAMEGFKDVIIRGQGLEGILLEAGILLGFAAVFFIVGISRFKYE